MGRRRKAFTAQAHEVVRRLTAQGKSVHEISRKAGVGRDTVLDWQRAESSGRITRSNTRSEVVAAVPSGITWGEALDSAWDVRRRAGARTKYRALLQRFAHSFAELGDPMPDEKGRVTVGKTAECGVCIPADMTRGECPGHNAPKLPRGFVYVA